MSKFSKLHRAYLLSFKDELLQGGEFYECIADLLHTEEIQSLAAFEQHLDINRLQHIISVSYISYRLCKHFNLNYKTAARGALLHDLFYYDWRENDWSHRPHGYLHPGFALKNAYELCGELDKLTANIIIRHMWPLTPTPPRYKLSFLFSISDKYCADKDLLISLSKKYRVNFYGDLSALGVENIKNSR